MNDRELSFAITFGTVYFMLTCCWLTRFLLKNRRTIRPLGLSRIISTNNISHTGTNSSHINFSGKVLIDNYVNSNIDIPIDNAHVIIQIIPEPIIPPPIAIGIPIQNDKHLKNV